MEQGETACLEEQPITNRQCHISMGDAFCSVTLTNQKNMKKPNPFVSSITFNSCSMIIKSVNSVKVKYIGAPIVGLKKKTILVSKSLVANL